MDSGLDSKLRVFMAGITMCAGLFRLAEENLDVLAAEETLDVEHVLSRKFHIEEEDDDDDNEEGEMATSDT